MGFEFSDKATELRNRIAAFMDKHVTPNEERFWQELDSAKDRWGAVPVVEEFKRTARAEGFAQPAGVARPRHLGHDGVGAGVGHLE